MGFPPIHEADGTRKKAPKVLRFTENYWTTTEIRMVYLSTISMLNYQTVFFTTGGSCIIDKLVLDSIVVHGQAKSVLACRDFWSWDGLV
jgi:hypothetical protein